MIEKLRWVVHFNRTKTLEAYDGYVWYPVPQISYDEEFSETKKESVVNSGSDGPNMPVVTIYQAPERRIWKKGDKISTQIPVID